MVDPSTRVQFGQSDRDLGDKICYKILTFQGKYKQEVISVSPNGYTKYNLVFTDLKFVWECTCLTPEERDEMRNRYRTNLVPLPPTTGPTAQPAGENYWQQREFSYVMEIEPTDVFCDPNRRADFLSPCEGKIECSLPDKTMELPGMCEGKNCVDRHIPITLGTMFFRCNCRDRVIDVARELRRDNSCPKGFNDGSDLECKAPEDSK
tara:strand:- start:1871 stop:2491 length:621 start_codon:yes stop_codon:yes gene_type:complete